LEVRSPQRAAVARRRRSYVAVASCAVALGLPLPAAAGGLGVETVGSDDIVTSVTMAAVTTAESAATAVEQQGSAAPAPVSSSAAPPVEATETVTNAVENAATASAAAVETAAAPAPVSTVKAAVEATAAPVAATVEDAADATAGVASPGSRNAYRRPSGDADRTAPAALTASQAPRKTRAAAREEKRADRQPLVTRHAVAASPRATGARENDELRLVPVFTVTTGLAFFEFSVGAVGARETADQPRPTAGGDRARPSVRIPLKERKTQALHVVATGAAASGGQVSPDVVALLAALAALAALPRRARPAVRRSRMPRPAFASAVARPG
jgi:ribonuclease E